MIAEVGGHDVTVGDFDPRYQSQVESYRSQFGGSVNESLLRQLGIEQQVLRQMIEEQVAVIEAERQGIRVSNEELAEQIMALPVFQESGQFIGETSVSADTPVAEPAADRRRVRGRPASRAWCSTGSARR